MQPLSYDTAVLPPEARLAAFQAGAIDFRVTPIGDPAAFASRWRMLKLGELYAIHSHTSPIRYERDAAMIAADGKDRITVHYYVVGGEVGTIDGRPVEVRAGGAMIWDLTRPLDLESIGEIETIIITLPRYMIDEVLPAAALGGALAPGPELTLAAEQVRYIIDHAADLSDAGSIFYGRALRDMFAVAMLPVYRAGRPTMQPDAPLLQRVVDLIDGALTARHDIADVARTLCVAPPAVAAVTDHFGGLPLLVERRRLLAAYRLLQEPGDTHTVAAIAHRCGFRSDAQFSRRFHDVFHASASDLRRHGHGQLPRWAGAYHVEQLYGAMMAPQGATDR